MFYRFARRLCWIVGYILYRFEVSGVENIPEEGAYLLCANHIHSFDPAVIAIFTKRQPRFIAKKELFRTRLGAAFFRAVGAFPVDRGTTDMQAYRHSMNVLKEGHGLLIFSQGTRMKEFENAKGGVAVFALKSGAPVIPVGITGSYRFRTKITLKIGEPIYMDEYQGQRINSETVDTLMEKITGKITELLD